METANPTPLGMPAGKGFKWLSRLLVLGLFAFGMWQVPIALLGPQQTLIPGDLGDARFNNYVLEHFHRYATGKEPSYWDAPFMYPYKNTIALSDNLLGTAPIYSAIRSAGFSRESAFQLWIVVLFALNFWCCFLALRKWVGVDVLAACGAYIFAFGIYNMSQMGHAQVFPKFMVPLAFWFLWRYLGSGGLKWFAFAVAAVVYQFYCGMYLGFMLVYGLFFLAVGHMIFLRNTGWWIRFTGWRYLLFGLLVMSAGVALLLPVILPYLHMQALVLHTETGTRTFADIADSLPRPIAFFFTHPGAGSWRIFAETGLDVTPSWWDQMQFVGALPWVAIIAAVLLVLLRRTSRIQRSILIALLVAFVQSWLFCLDMAGFSLYQWVFKLPGFSALRSVDRIINVQVMFFVMLFAFALRPLFAAPRRAWLAVLFLPLLVVQDNRWDVDWLKHFDKRDAQERVAEVQRRITREYQGPQAVDAIAYAPHFGIEDPGDPHFRLIMLHLTAMIAAQDLGIPVVNAYTGYYPDKYMGFFDGLDSAMLAHWTESQGTSDARIQLIDGLLPTIASIDTVRLRAANGAWVAVDAAPDRMAKAERDSLGPWESFLRLHTGDGRVALICANDSFLCAELLEQQQLAATAMDLGDYGLFTPLPQADGTIALQAHNGLYVSVDTLTHVLRARATAIGPAEKFNVFVPPFPH
ncbi:MAG: hypothetical protein IPN44_11640 [Flavobacteriales bacterium]|nr:hypothetical protein [Flavobacteriales bacterium]